MLLEKIFTFVLFLGPLVFFHELGHFIFARIFKVRVETFSIGFGPKLFKYKKGDTEYAISLIPLGGYVKMYGDDPFNKEAIPVDQQIYSYNHQNKWARFWIVLGGPLTNFLLAFFIFYGLLFVGEKFPEIKIGHLEQKSTFYQAGIRTGDVLLKVNGKEVYNPSDLTGDSDTNISSIEVRRGELLQKINLNLKGEEFFEEVMKHPPILRKPFVTDKDGRKYIVTKQPQTIDLKVSYEEMAESVKQNVYIYPVKENQELSNEKLEVDFSKEIIVETNATNLKSFTEDLTKKGFMTLDLMVKSLNFNSPADKAGIRGGDIFVSINKQTISSFEELRDILQSAPKDEVQVEIYHAGQLKEVKLTTEKQVIDGKTWRLMGVYSNIEQITFQYIQTKSKGIFGSAYYGVIRTWDTLKKMVDGLFKLITNQVSLKSVGGVLTIGKVANDSLKISVSYFVQLMALISINLGVINLFPMLPLDGGHILFLALELINGGPISRRKMEIAQQIGLSILLMLMVGSIFNDVTRLF